MASADGSHLLGHRRTGCGKTTLCRALLSHFPKGVHISMDDLRESVVSGFVLPDFAWPPEVDEQFRLARETATDKHQLRRVRRGTPTKTPSAVTRPMPT